MITFSNVHLRYPYDDFELLKGVSFTLKEGTNTILADTQSGKTSICRLICQEVKLTEGQIFVNGKDISSITSDSLGILYLPRNPVFFNNKSVLYNVEYPLRVRKVDKARRRSLAQKAAERAGISSALTAKIKNIDKNDRLTVALARGLTVERQIVLFDDFFSTEIGSGDIQKINPILQLFDAPMKVIVTSNADIAMGHTVVLDGGEVVFEGDAQLAKQHVTNLHWLDTQYSNL